MTVVHRLIADSFGCVIKGTETALNSSCSFSDAANIARAYGSEIQNSLSLRYNPIQCMYTTSHLSFFIFFSGTYS